MWEEAGAEPEELPALGLAVPGNTKPTVLLQPHIILGLITATHTHSDHTHSYREEKYTPIMVPFSRELQINIGSSIHLLCNNHSLHVKTMPSPA